jgi:hypothetical protein
MIVIAAGMQDPHKHEGQLRVETNVAVKAGEKQDESKAKLETFHNESTSSPQSATEVELAKKVDSFFQPDQKYTVGKEDFRDVLDSLLTYYKRRIKFSREVWLKGYKKSPELGNIIPSVKSKDSKSIRDSSLDHGIWHITCRQRLKERELEIKRLEHRIKRAGGIITDHLTAPEFSFKDTSLSDDKVKRIAKIIETVAKQIGTANDLEDHLHKYNVLLFSQQIADPGATNKAAEKLRQEITRLTSEMENAEKIIATEVKTLDRLLKEITSVQPAEMGGANSGGDTNKSQRLQQVAIMLGQLFKGCVMHLKHRADTEMLEDDLKRKTRVIQDVERVLTQDLLDRPELLVNRKALKKLKERVQVANMQGKTNCRIASHLPRSS